MSPTVAMGTEFLDGYAHIPASQQKKVREFLKKFRDDPTSNAINYESLKGHRNSHVRTVRIDQKYRAVVLHPDEGNVYVLRWESECFFRTYKRVVKDVRLVSRTVPMVVREAEISLLACQLLLGQGALALKVGGKRAGRDELKCSAAEVLREVRRELDAARKPVPRSSFAKRLQQTGRDRRERTGPKMKRQPPRRKKHVAPQPPRLKVLSAEQKRQIEALNLKEAAA